MEVAIAVFAKAMKVAVLTVKEVKLYVGLSFLTESLKPWRFSVNRIYPTVNGSVSRGQLRLSKMRAASAVSILVKMLTAENAEKSGQQKS